MSNLASEINKLKRNPTNPAPEPIKIKIRAVKRFFFQAKIAPRNTEKAPSEAIIKIGIKRNFTKGELIKSLTRLPIFAQVANPFVPEINKNTEDKSANQNATLFLFFTILFRRERDI